METYKNEFTIEIEKINELENLCKEFELNPISTPKSISIYRNKDLLVQEIFEKNKVKILISSEDKKLYNSFMKKFNKIYELCEN
jgi:hypothetical protein